MALVSLWVAPLVPLVEEPVLIEPDDVAPELVPLVSGVVLMPELPEPELPVPAAPELPLDMSGEVPVAPLAPVVPLASEPVLLPVELVAPEAPDDVPLASGVVVALAPVAPEPVVPLVPVDDPDDELSVVPEAPLEPGVALGSVVLDDDPDVAAGSEPEVEPVADEPVAPLEAASDAGAAPALAPPAAASALALAECFFLALCFFLVVLAVSPEAPELLSEDALCCACRAAACCSTSAIFAGSVLSVTSLDVLWANVAPAIETSDMNTAWDAFIGMPP